MASATSPQHQGPILCAAVVCVSSNAPTCTHLTFWFLMRRPFPCRCRRCCGLNRPLQAAAHILQRLRKPCWASCGHLAEKSGEEEDAAHLPLPDLSASYTDWLHTSPSTKSGSKKIIVVPGSGAAAGCCCRIMPLQQQHPHRGSLVPACAAELAAALSGPGPACCVPGGPRTALGAHTAPRDHDRR